MQWFFGMPKTVRAAVKLGKYHNIEVEDEVNAYLEYADGKTANFIASTGEAPGTNRLEIAGSRGKLTSGGAQYGDASTERAVRMALRWLKATQNADGSWGKRPELGLEKPMDAAAGAGHMFLPRETLEYQAAKLLQVDESIIDNALRKLLLSGRLVQTEEEETDAVYLAPYYEAEGEVARQLVSLMRGRGPGVDVEEAEREIDRY